jgi:hypothetical protein
MNTGPTVPLRSLLGLGVAVLAFHLWLLNSAPRAVTVRNPVVAPAFVTRSVALPTPVPLPGPVIAAAQNPRAQDKPPPKPQPKSRAREPIAVRSLRSPLPEPSSASATSPQAPATSASPPAAALVRFNIPPSVRLQYELTGKSRQRLWQGRGELSWRHDGASYQARLELSSPSLPARIQNSMGSITTGGLAPLRFSDKARSEEATHFERDRGKVSFSSNRPDAPLLAGAQDRLSVLLQLGAMLAGEPARFTAGTTLAIQTAGTREAEPWLFTVEGDEALALPGGSVLALKLSRDPQRDFEPKLELWLAPAMDYVPVRLRLTLPNGDWTDQQWSSTDTR